MKILVLSDSSDAARMFAGELQRATSEHTLLTAAWPVGSTSMLEEADLILLSVYTLEDTSALTRLRQITNVPILLLSSIEDDRCLAQLYAMGIDDHITRPVSLSLLRAKLQAWQRWVMRLSAVRYN